MNQVIGKAPKPQPLFSCKIIANKIGKWIAKKINNSFIDIGPELAKEIPRPARSFESYLPKFNTTMPIGTISVNELKKVFFSNKTNKRPGDNKMNFILNGMILIKSCFAKLCEPLQYLFNVSFEKSIFPDSLKIAKVTPILFLLFKLMIFSLFQMH